LPFETSTPANPTKMNKRPIPSTGEQLPVIGCGTWDNFDVGAGEEERKQLRDVLRTMFACGGSAIDSSPMYGQAEEVVGDLLTGENWPEKAFVATKVWTQGREAGMKQMQRSFELLRREHIDLMQVHNLVDWKTHLKTLRIWKSEGRIRYLGVTHYTSSAYRELEAVIRSEKPDFVQLNYSLGEREAEKRLLPLAADLGIAVIVNLPLEAGRALRSIGNKDFPVWASEFGCKTWAQVLLKFVLSNLAVTCAIPGTGNPKHMAENCVAGSGDFFLSEQCEELRKFWDARRG
jgi:diketogulonate reductase-like aldo/keto reductase